MHMGDVCMASLLLLLALLSGAAAQCPFSGWAYRKGRCYHVVQMSKSYDVNNATCASYGATLAVPNSQLEDVFIRGLVMANVIECYYHLGCQRNVTSKIWSCVDGSSLGYHDLHTNKHDPDLYHFFDTVGSTGATQTILAILADYAVVNTMAVPGGWHDYRPNRNQGAVCEYTLPNLPELEGGSLEFTVEHDTNVTWPNPAFDCTLVASKLECIALCTQHVTCYAVNYHVTYSACCVFLESLYLVKKVAAPGSEYLYLDY